VSEVTTEHVRHAAGWDRNWIVRGDEFDRWLERVKREARADALRRALC
jgi:hypothetical protein